MDEDKAGDSKEEVKSFVNEQANLKPVEGKKRKHISTWIGAFKAKDKAFPVTENYNNDVGLINKASIFLAQRLIEL